MPGGKKPLHFRHLSSHPIFSELHICHRHVTHRVGAIIGGVLGGLVLILAAFFCVHVRRSRKLSKQQEEALVETRKSLRERESQLKDLEDMMAVVDGGTTKYEDAVEYVGTLIDQNSRDEEITLNDEKLKLVKSCLLKGNNDDSMHLPQNLDEAEDAFIVKEFATVNRMNRRATFASRNNYVGPSTRNFAQMTRLSTSTKASLQCLPEFCKLDIPKQKELYQLLSFSSLKKWDFNIFDISAIDEENTLLFVSWAVICSPYAQMTMAQNLRKSGEEVANDLDDFDGYDFTGEY